MDTEFNTLHDIIIQKRAEQIGEEIVITNTSSFKNIGINDVYPDIVVFKDSGTCTLISIVLSGISFIIYFIAHIF